MDNAGSLYRRRLVVFAKGPGLGQVKTRLAKDIGWSAATNWYRHTAARVVRRLAADPRWQTILALSPAQDAIDLSKWRGLWPADIARIAQAEGDLGRRMEQVFLCLPPGPVLIVGSDIPGMTRTHIAQAFEVLRSNDAVIGPSGDGGYWCIGMNRLKSQCDLFNGVRWSSEYALSDTVRSLAPRRVGYAQQLTDVDTGSDLAEIKTP